MVTIPKIVGLLQCSLLLCLGLSSTAQADPVASAEDGMNVVQTDQNAGQADLKGEQNKLKGGYMIEGEVLRVEGENYFVKGQDGKEVRLHTDQTTQKNGNINQGDRIKAEMNDQNHALSIRAESSDRRNEHHIPTDSIPELGTSGSIGQ